MRRYVAALMLLLALGLCACQPAKTPDTPATPNSRVHACADLENATAYLDWLHQNLAADKAGKAEAAKAGDANRAQEYEAAVHDDDEKIFFANQDWNTANAACKKEKGQR